MSKKSNANIPERGAGGNGSFREDRCQRGPGEDEQTERPRSRIIGKYSLKNWTIWPLPKSKIHGRHLPFTESATALPAPADEIPPANHQQERFRNHPMAQIDGIQELHQIFAARRYPIKLSDLLSLVDYSPATLKRYIGTLREHGAPIRYDQKTQGYILDKSDDDAFQLPACGSTSRNSTPC
jgi:hypothetical protein